MEAKFIFNGGLGNQIFQYLASKYISRNLISLKISYSLSESILKKNRNLDLNKLLINPIETNNESINIIDKLTSKVINNFFFLKEVNKTKIKFRLNLINKLYREQLFTPDFEDPLFKLNNDLNLIQNKKDKLKIDGYWQNPSCYIDDLDNYMKNLIDTRDLLPKQVKPNQYITIHLRRGDYFLNKGTMDFYFSKFSVIKYIILSLQLLSQEYQNMPIYILSDDKSWREKTREILTNCLTNKFTCIETNNHFEDWSILRHASINICSNSTFSYTAALLNNENKDRKLRCIVPQWINTCQSAFEKGWLKPEGFIEV